MMTFVAGILPILIVISFIVTIHELGHYGMARLFKTKIEKFSVGFGKVLWSRTDKHGVKWCLSAIPLGGYVKFSGDESLTSMSPDTKALAASRHSITQREGAGAEKAYFHFKPLYQRALIVFAGPAANFLLAIVLFSGVLMSVGLPQSSTLIGRIEAGSPADKAGLKVDDEILSLDGRRVDSFQDVRQLVMLRSDTDVIMGIRREGQPLDLKVRIGRTQIASSQGGEPYRVGYLGIGSKLGATSLKRYNPIEALIEGNRMTWGFLDTNLTYIGRIFTGQDKPDQLSGLIGMTQASGEIAVASTERSGNFADKSLLLIINLVMFSALISVGVGFINLLPIPVLDGGHLLFYAVEAVTQKPVNAAIQDLSFRIGLASLLGLMLFAAYNDLKRSGLFGAIGRLFS
jgi:regulator of sigma E protease